MKRRTLVPPFAALALACALVAAAPQPGARAQTAAKQERIDGVAAVVNDEAILTSEVDEQLFLFLSQSRAGQPDSAQMADLRRKIIDKLIDEKLIVSEAKKQNVTVAEADIQKNVDGAIADAKQRLGTADAYQAELSRMGLTEAELRKRYHEEAERELLAEQFLRRSIGGKVDVTPAEAEKYFTDHPSEFPRRPSAVRVQLIQLPIEADSAQWAAVRKRANDALARVKKGEPFSRLAQELSEDTGTKQSGGDLGWFKKGTLDSTFENAAFKVPVGQVSGVVRTGYGMHLIKVEEADAERVAKRIEAIRQEAVKGMDFGTLARRYSKFQGPSTAEGDLGLVPMTAFSPDFKAVIDTLEIGEITPPLLNPQGFHLFKINDREAERAYKVEEIKDQLPELVRQAKLKTSYDTFVADLRKKASIQYR